MISASDQNRGRQQVPPHVPGAAGSPVSADAGRGVDVSQFTDFGIPDAYHKLDREAIKGPQRDRVVEYLLKRHTPRLSLRYFGLPDSKWATESIIAHEWKPGASFVAIERDWAIIYRGRAFMPGAPGYYFEEDFAEGIIHGMRTKSAVWVNFGCGAFLNLGRGAKRGKLHRRQFANKYKGWSAFWLDSCSTSTGELYDSLLRVDSFCNMDAASVPFALTFLLGRDAAYAAMLEGRQGTPLGIRVELIESILSSRRYRWPIINDSWTYETAGGVHMATVVGRLMLKTGRAHA